MFPNPQGASFATTGDLDISRSLKVLSNGAEGQGSEHLQGTPRDQLDTQLLKDSSAAPDQGGIFASIGDGQIDLKQLVASLNRIKTHNMQASASAEPSGNGVSTTVGGSITAQPGGGVAVTDATGLQLNAVPQLNTQQMIGSQDTSVLLQPRLREDAYGPITNLSSLVSMESQRAQDGQASGVLNPQLGYQPTSSGLQVATDVGQPKEHQTVLAGSDLPPPKAPSEQDSQPPTPKTAILPDEFVLQLKPHVTCKICHGVLSSAMVLSCGHSFCAFCLFKWLTENQTCPRCPVGLRSLPSRCTALDAVVTLLVPSLPANEQEHYMMRKTESETACSKVTKLFWHIAQGGSVSPIAQPQQANKLRFNTNPSQHITQQLQQGQVLGAGPPRMNTHIPQHTLNNQAAAARMMSQAGGYSAQMGMQMNMGGGMQLPSTLPSAQSMYGAQQQVPLQMVQPVANLQQQQNANLPLFPLYDAAGANSIASQQQQLLLQSNGSAGAWPQQLPNNMQLLYGNGLGNSIPQWAAQGRR